MAGEIKRLNQEWGKTFENEFENRNDMQNLEEHSEMIQSYVKNL